MPPATKTLIIPTLNETHSISTIVADVLRQIPDMDVVIVDDGSSDNTGQAARSSGARVVRHPHTMGNGAAVKSGIRTAQGDVLVFMDGDGQHDPKDIGRLLECMDRYDMVVGARTKDQHASGPRRFMNRVFNRLASYVTGFRVEDLTSGFRALRADTARDLLPLLPNGYSWPTTSTLVLLRSGLSVKYIPIEVRPRRHGRSRIRPVRDGIRFFMIILKICTLYSPLRIFLPVSGGMFFLGMINYAYTFFTTGRFTNMSALMFSAAVIIFMMGLISEQVSQISLLGNQMRERRHDDASLDE
jgi:glycosyltransferase involved in cell wall biosynthesis